MTYYRDKEKITEAIGNNALSFTQRKELWSDCTLTIPLLKRGNFDDIKIWNDIVFEEVNHKGELKSCIGIESLIEIPWSSPIYIMDNHNHALYLWYLEHMQWTFAKWIIVLHIDQHADMWVPAVAIDRHRYDDVDYISRYTNEICNVWNFIQPAIDSWLVWDIVQIRSVTKLLETTPKSLVTTPYILDIDIDFRVDHSPTKEEIEAVHKLLQWSSICTIALSPYFMPIEKSIEVTKLLFR